MEDIDNKNTFYIYSIGFEAYNFTEFFSCLTVLYNLPAAICILTPLLGPSSVAEACR
jgi:hypothetical protein